MKGVRLCVAGEGEGEACAAPHVHHVPRRQCLSSR